jgi:hypothetical protein
MLVFFVGFAKFCSNFNKDPNIQKKNQSTQTRKIKERNSIEREN